MQEYSSRLKTEGAVLSGGEMNIEKYGEQLRNELDEISRMLSKKNRARKEEEFSPTATLKLPLPTFERVPSKGKHLVTHHEDTLARSSKDKDPELRRNFIYDTESCKEEFEEPPPPLTERPSNCNAKSPYSETMSTSSSHTTEVPCRPGLSISDFQLGRKLGEGKFGQVFVAHHRKSGFLVALKRIERCRLDAQLLLQLVRQIKIQSFLNHPNIVKLYGYFSDSQCFYLLQELCTSGQLYALLKRKRRLPLELARAIVQQICRALDYMHECEIIHRDLKPENIIYHHGLIKICDFGWSISSKTMRQTFCGTPLYVSPELLKRKNYNNKIDVWSIGVLTYELLFGRVPFEIVSEKDFVKIIQDQLKFSKVMTIPDQAKDFIQACLKKDPRDRYTTPELLEHPFIAAIENPALSDLN